LTELQHPPFDALRHGLPPELLHNLRTPLNHIIGFSEMLTEQAQEEGQIGFVPDLQNIHLAARQMLTLLNSGAHLLPESASLNNRPRNASMLDVPEPAPEQNTNTSQALILVVDDNSTNREMLSRRLERQGYAVAKAENGRQAMDAVRTLTFDLVLLDIMMPEMDGYAVLQEMKADDLLRAIPVIMISALDDMDSVVRCIELGAEDHLPKPFDPTLLKARIDACLEKKRAHDREMRLYHELQQSYKHSQELEKQRDDLTNMIVHDLRTPLTSVIAGMQSLEGGGGLDEFQQEMVGIAISGGGNLLGMINDLLDVEKMESGSMQLDYATLDAGELVASASGQVASLCESKNLTLVRQVAAGLPAFRGDESKLSRVLVNLLGNAIKFTPEGGELTVKVAPNENGQSLVFSVSDTGEGIPPEAFERIFEKFGQVESRQGGRKMSTGLGLTFCKLAVEAHGGHIGVESAPGAGSTFSFTIPLGMTNDE
jgi:two-component system sensor histidine kinase/response regulator